MKSHRVLLASSLALSACRAAPARPASTTLTLDSARAVSATTVVGAAPMFAVSPAGAEAAAWVSAPGGGSDGRLYVSVNGAAPVELRDPLGPIEAHAEAPPKIAYGADGSLDALYVVGKVVPGKRFPLGALRLVRSADGGATWSAPVTVTDDGDFGSHNFHALHAAPGGALYVAWLDGRAGKSAAYMTRSADGGRTWSPNVRVAGGEACPCCRTSVATGKGDTVYVAWRQVYPGNVRDVVVARSADGGATWNEPVRVHADGWVFDGCPHAGPSLQVDGAGRLHVAWWTGKEGAAGVFYARSDDGARSFGAPVALGVARFSRPAHVQLALGEEGRVVAAWDDGTRKTPQVVVRVSSDGGATFGDPVTASAPGRAAGYPVLAVAGRRVTVAWTEQSADAAEHSHHAEPNMKDPKAAMGLPVVGESEVLVRRGEME
ncbi:MAG: sialidase family protein [Gemmatimonadaceae bacterium]